jgi:hypothetical protein
MLTAFLSVVQQWVGFSDVFPWLMRLSPRSAHWPSHLPNPITICLFCKKPCLGLLSLFLSEVKSTRTTFILVVLQVDTLSQEHILSERYALTGLAICLSPRWILRYEFAEWKTGIGQCHGTWLDPGQTAVATDIAHEVLAAHRCSREVCTTSFWRREDTC